MVRESNFTADQAAILQSIGEIAFRWNGLEAGAHLLLSLLLKLDTRADCLISQLGNVALIESINAISETLDDPLLQEHLRQFSKAFDRARTYRNHYVHGPRTMGRQKGLSIAYAQSFSIKGGKRRIQSATITKNDLDLFCAHLVALSEHLAAINLTFAPSEQDGQNKLSSVQKPPVLETLKVLRLSPEELRRQHQSSEG